MYDNIYIFIIWSKARFCEDKILNDLNEHFDILCKPLIKWSKCEFERNLIRFYGHKILYANDKICHCGDGLFRLIVVKDNSPWYDTRLTSAGNEIVNCNIFDCKTRYRKWTGGGHRIHCSNSFSECNHDMTILFGCNWPSFIKKVIAFHINNIKINYSKLNLINDSTIYNCLKRFDNNICINEDEVLVIYALNKIDIIRFLEAQAIGHSSNRYIISSINKNLVIFGEEDGELPEGFISKFANEKYVLKDFRYYELLKSIEDNSAELHLTNNVKKFFTKYNLNCKLFKKDSKLYYQKQSFYSKMKDGIKLMLCRIFHKFK